MDRADGLHCGHPPAQKQRIDFFPPAIDATVETLHGGAIHNTQCGVGDTAVNPNESCASGRQRRAVLKQLGDSPVRMVQRRGGRISTQSINSALVAFLPLRPSMFVDRDEGGGLRFTIYSFNG